jgi:hypothetical protein
MSSFNFITCNIMSQDSQCKGLNSVLEQVTWDTCWTKCHWGRSSLHTSPLSLLIPPAVPYSSIILCNVVSILTV